MKILKYGEGYPKTCTCDECKSELEYKISDIHNWYGELTYENHMFYIEECKCITCPVCNSSIKLESFLLPCSTPVEDVEPKPKKRWWQR